MAWLRAGHEFIANAVQRWLKQLEIETLYVAPGSPWQNGYAESFHSRVRDEFFAIEEFENLGVARKLAAAWKENYNHRRPHSSLGYVAPAEFAARPASAPECRVGPGDCSPRPLTEPDLWTTHPALQAVISNVKQALLLDGDPLLRI
ncbi:integrase core domain-containing protein [Adhaeretor mobilis]|uniref:integrase core domain-containing protein n=1 Tax=Adhaeretor mobilis TaxID=1930276 RepID=UPI001C54CC0F|nr:integrase core domain-containing protein [Adhaeretor mobilis]